ncbi:MAG: formate dehydrogenase accessory protein FdhE [Bacillota bacterium]
MQAEPKAMTQVIIDVHANLLTVQRSYRDRILQSLPAPVSAELPDTYILETEPLPFSPHIFREVCLRIAPLLAEQNPQADYVPVLSGLTDEVLQQLARAVQHAPEQDLPLALEMAVREVGLHKFHSLEPEALHMLLLAAFIPFFSAFARAQSALDMERWQKGWCPVCGQFPINGYNRPGDGRRILGCWLCETQWPYSRTACPVCGCDSREGLLLLTPLGGDRTRRLQVCEECGHYLKITDCTEASDACDLQAENSATVNLDILAQRKGYRPASHPQLVKN